MRVSNASTIFSGAIIRPLANEPAFARSAFFLSRRFDQDRTMGAASGACFILVFRPRGKRIGVSAYRRIGVSAFAKHHQLRRDLLIIIAVSKNSLTSPDADTPIRRPADTLPQPAAHFERNDVIIICETVHQDFFAEMLSLRPRSGSKAGRLFERPTFRSC